MLSRPKQAAVAALFTIILTTTAFCENDTNQPDPFKINRMLGRGINIGNGLDGPSEGVLGIVLKEEYFDLIKEAGFGSIRLSVRWSKHAMAAKPYTINPKFFKRVDWAINQALSRNLPVVLNVYHYLEINRDANSQTERFLALWKQIAQRYKDYPDILVFELLDEPHGTLTPETWNRLAKDTVAIVRQTNPQRTILIGPAKDSQIRYLKTLDLPKDDRNIIVTIHYFSPMEFTHQGVSWVPDSNGWLDTKWTATDEEKKAVLADFNTAAVWAQDNNRPINLGAFGANTKADMESCALWMKFIADTAVEKGMSFHYWEFCAPEFGLFDQQAKSFKKPLLDAVIPPK